MTLAGTQGLQIYASMTLYAGMIWSHTGALTFTGTGVQTITTAGVSISATGVTTSYAGAPGTRTQQDNFTAPNAAFNNSAGNWTLNGYTLSVKRFNTSNGNTRSLVLTNGTIQCTAAGNLTIWNSSNTSGLTLTATNSTVILTTTSSTNQSRTFPCTANFGAFAFNNLTINNNASYASISLQSGATVNGLLTYAGSNANSQRLYVFSSVKGTARTFTVSSTPSLTNVDYEDFALSGGGSPYSGTSVGDCGGNSGITFTAAVTRYWVGNGGAITDTAHWSTSSGGATGASFPLPQDTARFDANSFSSASQTVTMGVEELRLGTFDWSGVTNSPVYANTNATWIYGSAHFNDQDILSLSDDIYFSGRGSYTLSGMSAVAATLPNFTVDAIGGTYTLQSDLGNSGLSTSLRVTLVLTNGTFDANDHSLYLNAFSSSNSNARTLSMGNGTWYLSQVVTALWNCATTTNLTINAEGSMIEVQGSGVSSCTFSGGGKTYNDLRINRTGTGSILFIGSNTFNHFDDISGVSHSILFTAGTTTTVSSWSATGTAGYTITIGSSTAANHNLVKAGAGIVNSDYLSISRSQASPADTWYAGNNSTDGGNNTGWLFSAGNVDYTAEVSESISLSEALAGVYGAEVSLAEAALLEELLTGTAAFAGALSEELSLAEVLATQAGFSVPLSEETTLAEALNSVFGANASLSEALTLTEELLGALLWPMSFAREVSLEASLGRALSADAPLTIEVRLAAPAGREVSHAAPLGRCVSYEVNDGSS
jgi:hypothetical protein